MHHFLTKLLCETFKNYLPHLAPAPFLSTGTSFTKNHLIDL